MPGGEQDECRTARQSSPKWIHTSSWSLAHKTARNPRTVSRSCGICWSLTMGGGSWEGDSASPWINRGGVCREDPENQESKGKLQGASQRECIIQVREWKVGPAWWKVTGVRGQEPEFWKLSKMHQKHKHQLWTHARLREEEASIYHNTDKVWTFLISLPSLQIRQFKVGKQATVKHSLFPPLPGARLAAHPAWGRGSFYLKHLLAMLLHWTGRVIYWWGKPGTCPTFHPGAGEEQAPENKVKDTGDPSKSALWSSWACLT